MGAPVSSCAAQSPAGNHVGLPMRLLFEAPDAVIEWQQLKRPDPRVAAGRFVENDRCHKGRLYRHLATGKALTAATLKPPVGPSF
jgi:hypothetical protein